MYNHITVFSKLAACMCTFVFQCTCLLQESVPTHTNFVCVIPPHVHLSVCVYYVPPHFTATCMFKVCVFLPLRAHGAASHFGNIVSRLPGNTVKQWPPRARGQSARGVGGPANSLRFHQHPFHQRVCESVL